MYDVSFEIDDIKSKYKALESDSKKAASKARTETIRLIQRRLKKLLKPIVNPAFKTRVRFSKKADQFGIWIGTNDIYIRYIKALKIPPQGREITFQGNKYFILNVPGQPIVERHGNRVKRANVKFPLNESQLKLILDEAKDYYVSKYEEALLNQLGSL